MSTGMRAVHQRMKQVAGLPIVVDNHVVGGFMRVDGVIQMQSVPTHRFVKIPYRCKNRVDQYRQQQHCQRRKAQQSGQLSSYTSHGAGSYGRGRC